MRIKIIHPPTRPCIDGVTLDRFVPGLKYEVGAVLAAYLIAEGWAEPIDALDSSGQAPLQDFQADHREYPFNVKREHYPPYLDAAPIALDRRTRRRSS